jgi:diguanylate cyclase (GGDEF)-like protein
MVVIIERFIKCLNPSWVMNDEKLRNAIREMLIKGPITFNNEQELGKAVDDTIKGMHVEYGHWSQDALFRELGATIIENHVLRQEIEKQSGIIGNLKKERKLDGLTRLYNSTYLNIRLIEELKYSDKEQIPLSVIMFDIDGFGPLQNTPGRGHSWGDNLLKEVAGYCNRHTNASDIVCRYAGDEFTIIMPKTSGLEAALAAERLRKSIEIGEFKHEASQPQIIGNVEKVTLSLGVAEYKRIEVPADALLENRIKRAIGLLSGRGIIPLPDNPDYEDTVNQLAYRIQGTVEMLNEKGRMPLPESPAYDDMVGYATQMHWLIHRADTALYTAKGYRLAEEEQRKNCVVVCGPDDNIYKFEIYKVN